MAIKKTMTLPNGYSAEYIRIVKLTVSKLKVTLSVDLYKDKAARDAGKRPAICGFAQKTVSPVLGDYGPYSFEIEMADLDENLFAMGYDFLKTLEVFSGAEDV